MEAFPPTEADFIALALPVAISALPVVIAEIPFIVVLKQLLGTLK
jgi:hypothetical protein